MTTLEGFWAKVDKNEGCWLWTGALMHKGYGLSPKDNIRRGRTGWHMKRTS